MFIQLPGGKIRACLPLQPAATTALALAALAGGAVGSLAVLAYRP